MQPLPPVGQNGYVTFWKPHALAKPHLNQLDLRLGKAFNVGRLRLSPNLDVFNVLNANNVLAQNGSYSAVWRTPSGIVGGRLVKFSLLVNY